MPALRPFARTAMEDMAISISISSHSKVSCRVNCFIFEFHFSFYVTKQPLECSLAYTDVRKLRKFSWLGQRVDSDIPTRYIYEEQMSFILTGHGHDIYTCYQLSKNTSITQSATTLEHLSIVSRGLRRRCFCHELAWRSITLESDDKMG